MTTARFPSRPILSLAVGALLTSLWGSPAAGQAREWSVEDPTGPTTLLEFTATEGTWMGVDVSPDGRHLVFDLLGHLFEMPVEGGEARSLTSGRSWNLTPRYSPDGTHIAFTSDRSGSYDVWLLERSSGALTNLSQSNENILRPSWSPDGRWVYASSGNRTLGFAASGGPAAGAEPVVALPRRSGVVTGAPGAGPLYFDESGGGLFPFVFNPYNVVPGGWVVSSYDPVSGEAATYIERPGGAFNPALSPDRRRIAYLNRDIHETILILHDLETRRERVLARGLDLDRQEGSGFGGPYPNMAWHPDGRRLFVSWGGRIHVVDADREEVRPVAFQAPVRREMTQALRHAVEVPDGTARTRAHRWGSRTSGGILHEALGDLWITDEQGARNLTNSEAHETSPVLDEASGTLYFASWTDEEHGAVVALRPGSGLERLTTIPSQYGSLALSPDGRRLAYVRGTGALERGFWLSGETEFELVVQEAGVERVVTTVRGRALQYANIAAKIPPHVRFSPDGEALFYSDFSRDTLVVRRIGLSGEDAGVVVRFPHAAEVSLSPDLRWVAFREYQRSFLTPLPAGAAGGTGSAAGGAGGPAEGDPAPSVSAMDGLGTSYRVDSEDGGYFSWSSDGARLGWMRAAAFYEKDVAEIVAQDEGGGLTSSQRAATPAEWRASRLPGSTARRTDLSIPFDVHSSGRRIAFTGVRVVTMDPDRSVLEDATILLEDSRIAAIGRDVAVPADAQVFHLPGHTVIPGFVDAHAHPHIEHSALHVIEQRPPYFRSALAYGVTTMFEVYGNEFRDGWMSDMVQAGRMTGPRFFTTGSPILGSRTFRPRMYRPVTSLADAFEQLRWNLDHGATAVKDYGQLTRKQRHLTASAARHLGLNVVSESWGDPQMNLTQILDGVSGIEHSMGTATFFDDVVRFWGATGAGMTPTLLIGYGGPDGESWFHQKSPLWEDAKLTRFYLPQQLMRLRRKAHVWPQDHWGRDLASAALKLYRNGTPIHAGAHGQMPGLDMHWELQAMVDGGFTPAEALETATRLSAAYHGLDGQLGSLEVGKLADLVVLRENPLVEIRNAQEIHLVVKNGVVYSGDDASRVYPDPRTEGPFYHRAPTP